MNHSWRSSLCRCFITSEWNVQGGRQRVEMTGSFLVFFLVTLMDCWVDGLGHGCPVFVGLRVSYQHGLTSSALEWVTNA
jgi:hypothetical protein